MLKRILFLVLLVVIIGMSAIAWVIHSSWATGHLVKVLLQKYARTVKVLDLSIGDQQYRYPGYLSFSDVVAKVAANGQSYSLTAGKIDLDNLDGFVLKSDSLHLHADRLSLKSKGVDLPSADVRATVAMRSRQLNVSDGALTVPKVDVDRYTLENVVSGFTGGSSGVLFRSFRTDAYKGRVIGRIEVNWAHGVHYRANLQFEGVDISALKDVNEALYKQIEGVVQGTAVIGGSVDDFDTLRLKAQITKDGRINAALLKQFLPQIALLANSAEFNSAAEKGQKIPVEIVTVDVKNEGKRKISGPVHLGVRKFNLDVNTSVDILYDGSLLSLIGIDK